MGLQLKGRKRLDARTERINAWLSAVLLLVVVVLVNRLAARELRLRRDLSEDQLYAISDATRSILGRLEDRLLVKTFFTGAVESGDVALAKARIEAQLTELRDLGQPWVDVVHVDPSASTSGLRDTRSYGIDPRRFETVQGTQQVIQPVYLGLLLRYRGREQVIGWAEPWGFEVQFISAVHALLSERTLRVGWYEHVEPQLTQADAGFSSTGTARSLVAARAELVEVPDLRDGDARDLLDDLDVLIVVRPREEHPRAAFEIEQFIQGGGRVVMLIDQADYNILNRIGRLSALGDPPPRPLGALAKVLIKWKALPLPQHVWDLQGETAFNWLHLTGDKEKPIELMPSRSPALVTVGRAGFERSHSITAGLQRATLAWAQPLTGVAPPEGITRVDLLWTSDDAYRDDIRDEIIHLPERVQTIRELLRGRESKGLRFPLAAAFSGDFPPVFERTPEPWDPILDSDPAAPDRYSDEPVPASRAQGSLVVFGDADWIRDSRFQAQTYPFFNAPGNRTLFMNVLDWLALDEELIALRRKSPIERGLRNFEFEAQVELGVYNEDLPDTDAEARRQRDLRDQARAQARRREWTRMLLPLLGTLLLVAGFGLAWNLLQRRGARS
jgi:gliding motility-associatede transport system auxiliary component